MSGFRVTLMENYDSAIISFLLWIDDQIRLHPEQVTEADEAQLARIVKLVEGVDEHLNDAVKWNP